MSDDLDEERLRGEYPGPHSVPWADFARFFQAKLSKMTCAGCGEQDFAINSIHKDPVVSIFVEESAWQASGKSGNGTTPVIKLFCNNCGLLYKFASDIMLDWLRHNPTGTPDG